MLQQNNQLPAMFADVRRGLTIAAVVHGAAVNDTHGNEIDTSEFFGPSTPSGEVSDAGQDDSDAAEDDDADDDSDDHA